MKTIKWADFKGSMRVGDLLAQMPVYLTSDGEVKALIDDPKNIVTLSDLHPRIQQRIRALVELARAGKPVEKTEVTAL